VIAYADNAAVAHGRRVRRFYAGADGHYGAHWEATDYVIKVETHNHPTAIAPFPGAATGAGGEPSTAIMSSQSSERLWKSPARNGRP